MSKIIHAEMGAHTRALALCPVKALLADLMTREEAAALMRWCDCQTESLWDDMSLQEILNVYRVSAEWDTWESWRQEEFDAAGLAWNRAVISPGNHLMNANRRSLAKAAGQ